MSQYNRRVAQARAAQNRARRSANRGSLFGNPLFAVGLVVAAVLIFVLIRRGVNTDNGYYCEGVRVNNVDMSVYRKSEGEEMLTSWADGLVKKQYTLDFQGTTWLFTPKDVGASYNTAVVLEKAWNLGHTGSASERNSTMMSLRYSPQELWTEFTYDENKLDEFIDGIARSVYIAPVDADILVTATKPVVLSESQVGRALNEDALRETLIQRMTEGGDALIELPVERRLPAVSSDEAEHGLEMIAQYSTDLSASSSARCANVKLALSNFNGFVVKPGEAVSFNEIVGERTVLQGYSEAPVYYGDTVSVGVGGGVCQASSTLYGAMLKAGMSVVERHNHNMVVAYCEASTDAAVSEDASQDFVFANNTDYTIYVYVNVNRENATVMVYGRRPDYRIELAPTVLQNNIKNPNIATVKDETGNFAWYTDEYMLKTEGKLGRRSMLERVYYDWNTGEEVKRELISEDFYQGERDTYYVGVHPVAEAQP